MVSVQLRVVVDAQRRGSTQGGDVEPLKKNGQTSYRVRVGPEIKRLDAESLLKILKDKFDLEGIIVSYP